MTTKRAEGIQAAILNMLSENGEPFQVVPHEYGAHYILGNRMVDISDGKSHTYLTCMSEVACMGERLGWTRVGDVACYPSRPLSAKAAAHIAHKWLTTGVRY